MSLTYDQKSEIRMAFDEAYVAPERRRSMRVKHQVDAEIVSWKKGRAGIPFTIAVEDFSPTGVGVIHGAELPLGSEYVLKVPRPHADPLAILLTVVRIKPTDNERFIIGMEISNILEKPVMAELAESIASAGEPGIRRTSRRTKVLLTLFGIFGILAALLVK